jgi:hypothetical protein
MVSSIASHGTINGLKSDSKQIIDEMAQRQNQKELPPRLFRGKLCASCSK